MLFPQPVFFVYNKESVFPDGDISVNMKDIIVRHFFNISVIEGYTIRIFNYREFGIAAVDNAIGDIRDVPFGIVGDNYKAVVRPGNIKPLDYAVIEGVYLSLTVIECFQLPPAVLSHRKDVGGNFFVSCGYYHKCTVAVFVYLKNLACMIVEERVLRL